MLIACLDLASGSKLEIRLLAFLGQPKLFFINRLPGIKTRGWILAPGSQLRHGNGFVQPRKGHRPVGSEIYGGGLAVPGWLFPRRKLSWCFFTREKNARFVSIELYWDSVIAAHGSGLSAEWIPPCGMFRL